MVSLCLVGVIVFGVVWWFVVVFGWVVFGCLGFRNFVKGCVVVFSCSCVLFLLITGFL